MHAQSEEALHRVSPTGTSPSLADEIPDAADLITVMVAAEADAPVASWWSWMVRESSLRFTRGAVEDVGELAEAVERDRPQVLLMDARMLDGLDAVSLHGLRRVDSVRILLVVEQPGHDAAAVVLRHRFHGLLCAHSPPALCLKAIRTVSAGELWLPRSLMAQVLSDLHYPRGDGVGIRGGLDVCSSLTHRERQVVAGLRRGRSNKEIARELGIVEDTVKKHLHNIYAKLGVRRRALVILKAAATA